MTLKPSESLPQISASRKDEFYLNYLRGLVNDLTKRILGPQRAITWSKELQLCADLTYFGLTTLTELQTLGEEYTGLIQVGPSLNRTPSIPRRMMMIGCHTLLPYLIDKFLCRIESFISKNDGLRDNTNLQDMVHKLRVIFDVLNRLHLSVFYLQGLFFMMSKRVGGVQYLRYVSNGSSAGLNDSAFKLLGYMSLGQGLIALTMHLHTLYSEYKLFQIRKSITEKSPADGSKRISMSDDDSGLKCSLCLERRHHSTTTPCGHLFCWGCIHSWVNTKPECPICREKLQPQKLVYLRNFP